MAYVPKNQEEEDKFGAPTTAMGGGLIGGGGQGAGGTTPEVTMPETAPAPNSGAFENVKKYLQVNQPKIAGLANRVANVAKGDVAGAETAIGNASTQFGNKVAGGTVNYDKDLVNRATANPTGMAGDAETAAKIAKMYGGTYGGPTDFSQEDDYNQAQSAIQKAKESGAQLGSQAGLSQLMARANPRRATGGILALNNALLAGSDEAQKILAEARKGSEGLDARLALAAGDAARQIEEGKKVSEATKAATQADFGAAAGQFEQGARSSAANTKAQLQANASRALENFQSGREMSPEDLRLIGITPEQYKEYLGSLKSYTDNLKAAEGRNAGEASKLGKIDPYAYSKMLESDVNLETAATPEDFSRQAALNQLAGGGGIFQYLNNPMASGSYNTDLLDYRFQDLMDALKAGSSAAEGIKAPTSPFPNAYNPASLPVTTTPGEEEKIKATENARKASGTAANAALNPLATGGTVPTKTVVDKVVSALAQATSPIKQGVVAPAVNAVQTNAKGLVNSAKQLADATKTSTTTGNLVYDTAHRLADPVVLPAKKAAGNLASAVKGALGIGKKSSSTPAQTVAQMTPAQQEALRKRIEEGMTFNKRTKEWEV